MKNPDPGPDLPRVVEKRTVELCGDELRQGVRCVLPRGHGDEHEFLAMDHAGTLRWKSR